MQVVKERRMSGVQSAPIFSNFGLWGRGKVMSTSCAMRPSVTMVSLRENDDMIAYITCRRQSSFA